MSSEFAEKFLRGASLLRGLMQGRAKRRGARVTFPSPNGTSGRARMP